MKGKPLSETHPELAAQAVGWDPSFVSAGTNKKRMWKCSLGHTWDATPNNRTALNRGCPYCSNQKVLAGFNDLATTNPELAAEADGWDPTTVFAGSEKKVPWKCAFGHTWETKLTYRKHGVGCPYCSGRKVLAGFNDLATTNPELAAEADGWDPVTITAKLDSKKSWVCALGHQWESKVGHRSNGSGCPTCSGRLVLAGFNDLATTNPELAAEAVGWDPKTVSAGSNSRKKFKCELGHEWISLIANRASGYGCPYCSGHKVLVGFNDLATTHPDIAAQADGWNPKTVSAGSGLKKKFKCEFEHRWTTTILGRSSGRNCPSCAVGGYDPNKEGWLYFIKHDLWGLLQIGISNVPDQRLGAHKSSGWELLEVRGPMAGEVTYQWEQAILRSLLKRGVHLGQEDVAGKFSGYTEAWIQEDFPAKSLAELMQLVHEDESNRPRSV